jgi:hypothetical protein
MNQSKMERRPNDLTDGRTDRPMSKWIRRKKDWKNVKKEQEVLGKTIHLLSFIWYDTGRTENDASKAVA